jgi:hypothetical protein
MRMSGISDRHGGRIGFGLRDDLRGATSVVSPVVMTSSV